MIIAVYAVLGALAWTLTEYVLHRFHGHEAKGKNEFSREHLKHHAVKDYFGPTRRKLQVSIPIHVGMLGVLWLLGGPAFALAFTGGFAATYVGSELLHRRLHTHAPWEAYGRWARKHHFHHHFGNPDKNHGVTSPLWDIVFGTLDRPETVRVPPKMAMRWLFAGEATEVREDLAADFVLVRRPPRA